jgi:hypothetical protein
MTLTPSAFVMELTRKLAAEVTAVVRPDFPILFQGPDILLAQPGKLVAIFMLKRLEQSRPEILLGRLLGAKLAMHENARTLLLVQGHERVEDAVARDFNEVLLSADMDGVVRFVGSQKATEPHLARSGDTRRIAHWRYSMLYSAARRIARGSILDRFDRRQRLKRSLRVEKRDSPKAGPTMSSERLRYTTAFKAQEAIADDRIIWLSPDAAETELKEGVRHTLMKSFGLDNGVPYVRNLLPDVLLAEDVPLDAFDPVKPLRAAAFGGCLVAPSANADLAEQQIGRIDKRLSRMA